MTVENIYPKIVYDLNPRIKRVIDELNRDGQIDVDSNSHPFVLSVQSLEQPNTYMVYIVRNGTKENFVVNTRKQKEPVLSWNPNDGYKRPENKKEMINQQSDKSKSERKKRFETYKKVVNHILKG